MFLIQSTNNFTWIYVVSFCVFSCTKDALRVRVHDLDERVRQNALRVLSASACSKPSLIRRDLIEMVFDRCLDKKVKTAAFLEDHRSGHSIFQVL